MQIIAITAILAIVAMVFFVTYGQEFSTYERHEKVSTREPSINGSIDEFPDIPSAPGSSTMTTMDSPHTGVSNTGGLAYAQETSDCEAGCSLARRNGATEAMYAACIVGC